MGKDLGIYDNYIFVPNTASSIHPLYSFSSIQGRKGFTLTAGKSGSRYSVVPISN